MVLPWEVTTFLRNNISAETGITDGLIEVCNVSSHPSLTPHSTQVTIFLHCSWCQVVAHYEYEECKHCTSLRGSESRKCNYMGKMVINHRHVLACLWWSLTTDIYLICSWLYGASECTCIFMMIVNLWSLAVRVCSNKIKEEGNLFCSHKYRMVYSVLR